MTHLKRKLTFALALVAGSSLVAAAVAACSSEDTTVSADSGSDVTTSETSTPETSVPDTSLPDGGPDVIQVDAATIDDFIALNAQVACERLKECCAGKGAVDVATCTATYKDFGWALSLGDVSTADKTKLAYDPVVGSACLTAARNLACTDAPAAAYKDSWTKCYAAVKGTVAANAACKSVAECIPTTYCDTAEAGTCQPIKAVGSACTLGAECSYRSVGSAQCALNDAGATTCTNLLKPNGTDCNYDQDCASGACLYNPGTQTTICSDKQTWYSESDCTRFVGDAGDGGDGG